MRRPVYPGAVVCILMLAMSGAVVAQTDAPSSSASTEPVELLWSATGRPDGLDFPNDLALDPQGRLWVADTGNDRFAIFDPEGTFVETWGASGTRDGEFRLRRSNGDGYGAIAFAPDGSFYVLDVGNRRIQHFGPDRAFLAAWGSFGTEPGQYVDPVGLDVTPDGTVYVLDDARDVVEWYAPDGTVRGSLDAHPGGNGGANTANSLAIGADGSVYVTSCCQAGNFVERIDPAGDLISTIGARDQGFTFPDQPSGIDVDADGRTFVTSRADAFAFSPDGALLADWSVPAVSDGSFAFPFGVQLDDQGAIYIADAAGNRIDKFALLPPLVPGAASSPAVSAGTAVGATDWAISRGDAGRDGHGTDGPIGNPVLRWRHQTQGSLNSPIAIVGDLVYATSDDGILHALDLATGDERWTYAPEHTQVSGPSLMDGVVYVFDADGTLIGLDALTGEERMRAAAPLDGPGTPTLADGTVYVGTSDGDLVALDGTTGEARWATSVSPDGPAHSPATADGRVYVGGTGRFIAVDAQSGDILWMFDTGNTETATAVVADGIAYVGTSADVEVGHLWALDAVSGEVRWTVDEAWFSPAVADGTAFSGSDAIGVAAHDTATGAELWRFVITGTTRPLAVADGVVYVPADDEHRVYALDAVTGAERWRYEVDGGNDCCAAVSHGAVFVGTTFGGVYAIGGDGTAR